MADMLHILDYHVQCANKPHREVEYVRIEAKPRPIRKSKSATRKSRCIPQSQVVFMNGMRKLWIDHANWTRNAIISLVAGIGDTDAVVTRLLKNQDDIGNYVKRFYGGETGDRLADLLREHIIIAGQLVGAAKAGDQEEVERLNKAWYQNADAIAALLSQVNPFLHYVKLKHLLHVHLEQVFDQAAARIGEDWDGDIKAFDEGEDHIIRIADYIANGIIKQSPGMFRK